MDKAEIEIWRRRLAFRCQHRGTRESDLLFSHFATQKLKHLDTEQLHRLEILLACVEPDLYDWISGRVYPPLEHRHDVLQMLIDTRTQLSLTNLSQGVQKSE